MRVYEKLQCSSDNTQIRTAIGFRLHTKEKNRETCRVRTLMEICETRVRWNITHWRTSLIEGAARRKLEINL